MNHLPRIGRRSLLAVAVAAAVAFCLAGRPDGGKAAPVPEGAALSFVPADAIVVASVHVADLWKHPAGKAILQKLTEGSPDIIQAIRGQFGVGPADVDRVTLFVPALGKDPDPRETEPLIAVTTLRPYDRKAILAAAVPNAEERKVKGRTLYFNDRGPSFVFLDSETFLFGSSDRLEAFLGRPAATSERPLGPVLRLADKHLAVAGADVAAVVRRRPLPNDANHLPPDIKAFLPLFKVRLATLTVDLDDKLRGIARATFPTESDARDGAPAVDALLDMAREAFGKAMRELPALEYASKTAALLREFRAAIRAVKAEQKGNTVEVAAELAVDPEATSAAATEIIEKVRKEMHEAKLTKSLKELALAVHDYHDANGFLPPAAITDKSDKPLLSWRVALLPYIGEGKLYNEFRLDETWDSDHNKKLLEKMPAVFAPPGSQASKDHETPYQALVGKGTVFDGTKLTLVQITDGTSNTILFVEAKKGVPWTKPEDLPVNSDKLTSKLGGGVEGKFMAAMCDGSVHFFPLTMKEETLRIWAMRNSGQVRPEPEK